VRHRVALLAAVLVLAAAAPARDGGRRRAVGSVILAGERAQVRWIDGDTFRVLSGQLRGVRARLDGVNALETFGPVHRIGAARGRALLALARESAALAAAAGGPCEPAGSADRYGRILVACPVVARALVEAGHAVVMAVDHPADPELLRLQREAQRLRAGMWKGGAPPLVPTSLHSADEPDLGPAGAYDRWVDTRTGASDVRRHARAYRTCEEVCDGEGETAACLVYVPFARRYRDRPGCLR
jgi:endonuclease YncB( thermonuclease family)